VSVLTRHLHASDHEPVMISRRFPAQETISGASKIPTIIYYDLKGKVRAVGAEATQDGIFEEAMEGGWFKAEW